MTVTIVPSLLSLLLQHCCHCCYSTVALMLHRCCHYRCIAVARLLQHCCRYCDILCCHSRVIFQLEIEKAIMEIQKRSEGLAEVTILTLVIATRLQVLILVSAYLLLNIPSIVIVLRTACVCVCVSKYFMYVRAFVCVCVCVCVGRGGGRLTFISFLLIPGTNSSIFKVSKSMWGLGCYGLSK
jgi:hypothetical protein